MKILTGINKWQVFSKEGVCLGTYGTQADADQKASLAVVNGDTYETLVHAVISRFVIPPVVAVKMDV